MELVSTATHWHGLAADILVAIEWLERLGDAPCPPYGGGSICLAVAPDFAALGLGWGQDGEWPVKVTLQFAVLPAQTDAVQDSGAVRPNASLHRALCKAAAEMLDWHKDPETFELIESQRYRLFMRWPGEPAEPVDEWAFGLWD